MIYRNDARTVRIAAISLNRNECVRVTRVLSDEPTECIRNRMNRLFILIGVSQLFVFTDFVECFAEENENDGHMRQHRPVLDRSISHVSIVD
jgi:hypothetical protein